MKYKKNIGGFTLIEVLITIVILSIALVALYKSNIVSLGAEKKAEAMEYEMLAADFLMKDALKGGFPATGIVDGEFKKGVYAGIRWKRTVESFNLPMLEDLRKITVEVHRGKNDSYKLTTVVSRYR